ncbi:hypothetical protein CXB51_031288 [Gossypium anomalum]|uniref:NADH-plastoquinone oxidoreductase subunit 1 n=1 Tax=Gossypium anomalum TaxID=47600 RepID=A0A8J5YBR4_9ROSI|nr:hypothetical protein CXB51_031288 [Gossypium anomalum]
MIIYTTEVEDINSFYTLESLKEVYGIIRMLVPILTLVLGITIGVLVIVWLETEISAGIQQRIGPEYAGPLGILQALADGTKLLFKENILPSRRNTLLFSIGPAVAVISILLSFSLSPYLADLNIVLLPLDFLCQDTDQIINIPFLGGLRTAAQSISYEIPLCVLSISLQLSGGKRKRKKSLPQDGLISQSSLKRAQKINCIEFSLSFVWIPIHVFLNKRGGIEQKRVDGSTPPDSSPEYPPICRLNPIRGFIRSKSRIGTKKKQFAEEELVTGYQTEYSGIKFGLFYVASYLNLLLSSLFVTVLYLGGWNISIPYVFVPKLFEINKINGIIGMTIGIFITLAKTYLFLFISIATRWTLPRLRMDQLLNLGWKFLLPISLGNLLLKNSFQLLSL